MIQDQFHPLDEIGVWGCTAHGLLRFDPFAGYRRFVDGTPWPLPQSYSVGYGDYPLQIVRQPGIEPVPLSDEVLAAERAQGRAWQNYALLQSGFTLLGRPIGGWIYWASNGVRWVLRPGALPNPRAGLPYSVTLDCLPFGYIDGAPVAPMTLVLPVADIGQEGSSFRGIEFESINSTGSRAILRLRPVSGGLPTGFLEVSIADTNGVLHGALSVHMTQAAVRGEWSQSYTAVLGSFESRNLAVLGTLNPPAVEPRFPPGGGSYVMTVSSVRSVVGGPGAALVGSDQLIARRTGRVIGLVFDDADHLVEYAYETSYQLEMSYPEFDVAISGSSTGSADHDAFFQNRAWTTEVQAQLSRNISEHLSVSVSLLRDGTPVATSAAEESRRARQVRSVTHASTGGWSPLPSVIPGLWELASGETRLVLDPGFAQGSPTGQAAAIAPYDDSWDTSQPAESVSGAMQLGLLTKMPTGPADADTLTARLLFRAAGEFASKAMSFSVLRQGPMARLLRTQPRPPPEVGDFRYEFALIAPRAAEYGRGRRSFDAVDAAYHPVTHELVTDEIGGVPQTFI